MLVRQRGGVSAKRIAEAVHGPYVDRGASGVTERRANLGHQIREVGFFDDGISPDALEQLSLGERFRTIQHERRQQLERLRLEVNFAAGLRELPRVEIQCERAEANLHREAALTPRG